MATIEQGKTQILFESNSNLSGFRIDQINNYRIIPIGPVLIDLIDIDEFSREKHFLIFEYSNITNNFNLINKTVIDNMPVSIDDVLILSCGDDSTHVYFYWIENPNSPNPIIAGYDFKITSILQSISNISSYYERISPTNTTNSEDISFYSFEDSDGTCLPLIISVSGGVQYVHTSHPPE